MRREGKNAMRHLQVPLSQPPWCRSAFGSAGAFPSAIPHSAREQGVGAFEQRRASPTGWFTRLRTLALVIALAGVGMKGCEQDAGDPVEEALEEVWDAADDTGDALEEAVDDLNEAPRN